MIFALAFGLFNEFGEYLRAEAHSEAHSVAFSILMLRIFGTPRGGYFSHPAAKWSGRTPIVMV